MTVTYALTARIVVHNLVMAAGQFVFPIERIVSCIYLIPREILATDLAQLYGVSTISSTTFRPEQGVAGGFYLPPNR